jgi:hypothetical protein
MTTVSPRAAETPAEVVKKWGLLGQWGRNCRFQHGSVEGAEASFEIESNGRAVLDTGRVVIAIVSASVNPEGELVLDISRPEEPRVIVLQRNGDEIRTVHSPPNDSSQVWLRRCIG